ncbi:MAG: hypothetical protein HY674_22225 [Chloroflexi bacterium]|nr:hypothetical protein [Chloroflexota bacterium]
MLSAATPPKSSATTASISAADLPKGNAPAPVPLPHFPDRLHAFVWRNWPLVPVERMADVVGASKTEIVRLAKAMGLPPQPRITRDQQRRSYITVLRRNWHLLPYEQLLQLLDWTPEQMAFTLREDDFLFVKLGSLKPSCARLRYVPPDENTLARRREIAHVLRAEFAEGWVNSRDPLFGFVSRLSAQPPSIPSLQLPSGLTAEGGSAGAKFSPRFCYSYFALYGDPLLEIETDPYPAGYLARLASAGVNGVWLQGVLHKLAPFPWDPKLSARHEERLANLRALVKRARRHGVGIFLYLNEPRSMPLAFFDSRPQMKGAVEGGFAAHCTSHPDVQKYLVEAVAQVCRAVPDLAGLFTISGSENLTNCWSHGGGASCPRCGQRSPSEVIAEVNGLFHQGLQQAGSKARLIVWDWGWADGWVEGIINRLPADAALMSVSEWSIPINRGGIATVVGEYSISTIGPGPRAQRHWELARRRGLKTVAKIQAGNTWELSAVPYIPAVENVARHAANLLRTNVDGLMLGWTLGGYPSPNLEVVAEIARTQADSQQGAEPAANENRQAAAQAMQAVAERRFGKVLAPAFVQAWREFSAAFSEFPFHGGLVYNAPMQYGPSNLLWAEPTGYHATMIGFPYDDLDGWRAVYPPEVFIALFQKVADGFDQALAKLNSAFQTGKSKVRAAEYQSASDEITVAEAATIHFRTTANQARFVQTRRALAGAKAAADAQPLLQTLQTVLQDEIRLAKRLHALQSRDARLGFEASNHYYYVPSDLAEKVLNCRDLLDRWLPAQRAKFFP